MSFSLSPAQKGALHESCIPWTGRRTVNSSSRTCKKLCGCPGSESYVFSFEPRSNCACIFYFKLRLLLEGMEKIIDSLLKEDT